MIEHAILCRVGHAPEIIVKPVGLAAMQALVGGLVDCVQLMDGIDLWLNDEGLYTCEPNRLVEDRLPIYGDFFICGNTYRGETCGLSVDECIWWLARVSTWPTPCVAATGGAS